MLNKLTPEKFEQLLRQLLDAVKSVVVLRGLITLIFENAVAQVRPPRPHCDPDRTLGLCSVNTLTVCSYAYAMPFPVLWMVHFTAGTLPVF